MYLPIHFFIHFYSARACRGEVCPNLQPPHLYEAHIGAKPHCTHDVKDVINCIGGGVHVIFPLLETAAFSRLVFNFLIVHVDKRSLVPEMPTFVHHLPMHW